MHVKPGPELDKLEREVANYERFRALVAEVTEVNEAICEARPVGETPPDEVPVAEAEKGGSSVTSKRSSRRR